MWRAGHVCHVMAKWCLELGSNRLDRADKLEKKLQVGKKRNDTRTSGNKKEVEDIGRTRMDGI